MTRVVCAALGLFLTLGIAIADEPKAPESQAAEASPLRLVVSNAYLRYLINKLPNKVGVEPGYTLELRKKLQLPESMTEVAKASSEPAKPAPAGLFAARLQKVLTEAKGQCDLAMQLPQLKAQLKTINETLQSYGAECKKYSGLNLCVELESDLLSTSAYAMKQAIDGSATMVVVPPGAWEKTPEADRKGLGHFKVKLHLPELKAGKYKLLETDLGEIEIVWNLERLKRDFAQNRGTMRDRAGKWFETGLSLVPDEEIRQAIVKAGFSLEQKEELIAEARFLVEDVVEETLLAATHFLETKVFCQRPEAETYFDPFKRLREAVSKDEKKETETH